jgi:hypothetical protein
MRLAVLANLDILRAQTALYKSLTLFLVHIVKVAMTGVSRVTHLVFKPGTVACGKEIATPEHYRNAYEPRVVVCYMAAYTTGSLLLSNAVEVDQRNSGSVA